MASQFEIDCALMAGRAYQTNRNPATGINWFPVPAGWTEFSHIPNPTYPATSGFEASAFQSGNRIVISFAGTEPTSLNDWLANAGLATGLGSVQLVQAADYYLKIRQDNPDATITFTGHSLGGGLAALMGVFFNQQAVTFDQAPFANSATTVMRDFLVSNLLALQDTNQQPLYTSQQLMALAPALFTSNFNPVDLANSNVTTIRVVGEFTSESPVSVFSPLGPQTPLLHGPTDISMFDLHTQSLLAAFVQSDQFRQVTFKLTDLLEMIFDSNLFKRDTAGTLENFLERLVRHQNGNAPDVATADAMLTRFTEDLWKIAQDGGLTLTNSDINKTLIAFAMQMYYPDTANATNASKQLFSAVTGGGGIHFDRLDVADTLNLAIGYNLYFQKYLNSSAFTDNAAYLIRSVLPTLRDWYVQAGSVGMNVADTQNRGAFLLGGTGADNLTGGTQADLLVGNAGGDTLNGSGGNDTLLGGSGFDTYLYNTGDGTDTVDDRDDLGRLLVNGQVLSGGIRRAGDDPDTFHSTDNAFTFVQSGTTLTINGQLTVTNWQTGELGLTLRDLSTLPTDTAPTINYDNGLSTLTTVDGDEDNVEALFGNFNRLVYTNGGNDYVLTGVGNDQLFGGTGHDYAEGGNGHDRLYGEAGRDNLVGLDGDDWLEGGDEIDSLKSGYGNDYVKGGWERNHVMRNHAVQLALTPYMPREYRPLRFTHMDTEILLFRVDLGRLRLRATQGGS